MSTKRKRRRKKAVAPELRGFPNFHHYYSRQGLTHGALKKAKHRDFEYLHSLEGFIGHTLAMACEDHTDTECDFRPAVGRRRQRAVRVKAKPAVKGDRATTVTTLPIAEVDTAEVPDHESKVLGMFAQEWKAEIVRLVTDLNERAGMKCISIEVIEDTIARSKDGALSVAEFLGNFAMHIGGYRIPEYDAGRIALIVSTHVRLNSNEIESLRQCILKAARWRVESLDKSIDEEGPEQLSLLESL